MELNDDFFNNIKIEKRIIDGAQIELPIRYYKDEVMMGAFIAPTSRIKSVLPTTRFKPVEILPSLSLVSIIGLRHIDTSIGPFNELDIGIPVFFDSNLVIPFYSALKYHSNPNFGTYMLKLYVSDKKALTAGIKVWNYPKVIADIIFEENESHKTMIISKDNNKILTLKAINKGILTEKYNAIFNIFSIKDNMILKSPVNWRGERFSKRFKNIISFDLGDSEFSKELKSLNLMNYCVEGSIYPELQYILNVPTNIYNL